jgi:16S rRNA (uracil1498-N3)-methyltransferase
VTLPHFFVGTPLIPDETGRLSLQADGELNRHLRSARIRPGEHIVLIEQPGEGLELLVRALSATGALTGSLVGRHHAPAGKQLTLVQGISKSDSMDRTVRQVTELGVTRLIPLECERSTVQLDAAGRQAKLKRWQRLAKAAAEQSARLRIPAIEAPCDLAATRALLADYDGLLLLWEEAPEGPLGELTEDILKHAASPVRIAVIVGPEGGFSTAEVAALCQAGARLVSLGASILRTETAALVASALVLYHLGGLGATAR